MGLTAAVHSLLPNPENQQLVLSLRPKTANFERSATVWSPGEIEPFNSALLGPIIDRRQLRVCIIVGNFCFNGRGICIIDVRRVVVISGLPQSKVL
jgi:hypothetical protein